MLKQDAHIFTGMVQDISVSKQKPEFLWEARNIRFTARGEDTLLSLTNEKGTKRIVFYSGITEEGVIQAIIKGSYVGHCVLNNYLIVFTHDDDYDRVYKIDKSQSIERHAGSNTIVYYKLILLAEKKLNFSNTLETLGVYETELIQKVYWVDGINPPRVINIADEERDYSDIADPFSFVQELQLKEEVKVSKEISSTGLFPAGVLQYVITYYNKYGQESNIAYTTPLYHTSFLNRAGSPEESISNAFRITIKQPDTHFDYVRVYSILRTSINATPVVKRVSDIELDKSNKDTSYSVSCIDNNTSGDSVDPTWLLYVGGEDIVAGCMTQKDGTLFLGDIEIKRQHYDMPENTTKRVSSTYRRVKLPTTSSSSLLPYSSTLNAINENDSLVPTNYFRALEGYRLGVQFQYKDGKWSEPCLLTDIETGNLRPILEGNTLDLPSWIINIDLIDNKLADYRKARPVAVFPAANERRVIAQGIACPTVYSLYNKGIHAPDVQSSWFLRLFPALYSAKDPDGDYNRAYIFRRNKENISLGAIPQFQHNNSLFHVFSRGAEIQNAPMAILTTEQSTSTNGYQNPEASSIYYTYINSSKVISTRNKPASDYKSIFLVNQKIVTFHSPEIELGDISSIDSGKVFAVGTVNFSKSYGDISITTSSPTIDSTATGFYHTSLQSEGVEADRSLVSGLFYRDSLVKKSGNEYLRSDNLHQFMIYPWQSSGAINNDNTRDNGSVTSSVLKRKVISNIKYSDETSYFAPFELDTNDIQVFNSDQVDLVKLGNSSEGDLIYYGNIDTTISPIDSYGVVYTTSSQSVTSFDNLQLKQLTDYSRFEQTDINQAEGTYKKEDYSDSDTGMRTTENMVRMKYKSSPHGVITLTNSIENEAKQLNNTPKLPFLMLLEICRENYPTFGVVDEYGKPTLDALKQNLWIPAGEAVPINRTNLTQLCFDYGDTFYQRYDCLKTYPFTQEDENSIVEIASFMVETRLNIDGRYDKNRSQISNLTMNSQNFNLWNPVYSQQNNFFNYRILDSDYYKSNKYGNTITWSKEKKSGDETDAWTNITLASTIDLDGTKGKLNALETFNNTILAFQDKGISEVLFNTRVQVPVSDGVPIELQNNYKVEGTRSFSDIIGCSNKRSIIRTNSGLYFVSTDNQGIYKISDGISNVTDSLGFNNWVYKSVDKGLQSFYDAYYNDIYFTTNEESLVYSEKLNAFTSFMDYSDLSAMVNIGSDFYALKGSKLYKLFDGEYNYFFDEFKPFSITFISNRDSFADKIFSTVETRTDFYSEGELSHTTCFDYIRAQNEYQDTGKVPLKFLNVKPSNLKKKFRVWRVQVPRVGLDRIRNTWSKFTLGMYTTEEYEELYPRPVIEEDEGNYSTSLENNTKMELHDIAINYFI